VIPRYHGCPVRGTHPLAKGSDDSAMHSGNSSCSVDAYIYENYTDGDALRETLASQAGLSVRHVEVEMSLGDFFNHYKLFNLVLTRQGFDLEGRDVSHF